MAAEHSETHPALRPPRAYHVRSNSSTGASDLASHSDTHPLLANNTPARFTWKRPKHADTSEVELVNIDASWDSESIAHSQKSGDSHWSAYNPFSNHDQHLLFRKLRSSGPALAGKKNTEDAAQDSLVNAQKVTGWRAGTRVCCIAVVSCIIIELVLLIWAVATNGRRTSYGLIYEGSCATVRELEVWLLLPLNIAATVLIGTSNYVMQVMSAPDREEIDEAHRFAHPIAVGGIRFSDSTFNGARAGKRGTLRRTVWWVLVLSSLPIHLLLNVAFYGSVQGSNTGVVVVSDDFATDLTWNRCSTNLTQSSLAANFTCSMKQSFDNQKLRQLSVSECKSQYARGFQTNASSVIVVTDQNTSSWYNMPYTARVPASYGLACQTKTTSSGTLLQLPDAERLYNFSYVESTGFAMVNVSFPFCQNNSQPRSSPPWFLSIYTPPSLTLPVNSSRALILRQNDSLSSIASIRSLFDAVDYRYWATAEATNDYLSVTADQLLSTWDARSWLCDASGLAQGRQCDPTKLQPDSEWVITPAALPVKECHVMPKEEKCTLRYSLKILVITLGCDLVKLMAMIFALRSTTNPLTTLGDIIQSFLQRPDPFTQHMCLLDDNEAARWAFKSRVRILEAVSRYVWITTRIDLPSNRDPTDFEARSQSWVKGGGPWWTTVKAAEVPDSWKPQTGRWAKIPSRNRWIMLGILYWSSMTFLVIYFSVGLMALQKEGIANAWTVGFSGPDPSSIFTGGLMSDTQSITWAAIVVNLPQVLFSSMYFVFNATLTMMHSAHEWGSFTKHRKALRVSSPRGQQRSTYWLQLPWSYSLPLITASGLLHWLLGRSVYLVKVDVFDYNDNHQADKDFFACGFSLITVLILIILLSSMGFALAAVSFTKLASGIPLVRLNSLAIAAACHPDPTEEDLALKPLMWGVIDGDTGAGVPHCSFSAKEVAPLLQGYSYI